MLIIHNWSVVSMMTKATDDDLDLNIDDFGHGIRKLQFSTPLSIVVHIFDTELALIRPQLKYSHLYIQTFC